MGIDRDTESGIIPKLTFYSSFGEFLVIPKFIDGTFLNAEFVSSTYGTTVVDMMNKMFGVIFSDLAISAHNTFKLDLYRRATVLNSWSFSDSIVGFINECICMWAAVMWFNYIINLATCTNFAGIVCADSNIITFDWCKLVAVDAWLTIIEYIILFAGNAGFINLWSVVPPSAVALAEIHSLKVQ